MFKSFRESISRRNTIRRTRKELSALTDRELDDIGLRRADILRVSLEA